jgi:hypothetical protein
MNQITANTYFFPGQRVTGTYCNYPVTGRLASCQRLGKQAIFWVDLDNEIMVFGQPRNKIGIQTGKDQLFFE